MRLAILVVVDVDACDPDNDPVDDATLKTAAINGVRNALYEAQGDGFNHPHAEVTSIIMADVKALEDAGPLIVQQFAEGPQVVVPYDLTGLKVQIKKM